MVYVLDTNIFRKLLDHFPKKEKHLNPSGKHWTKQ